MTCATGRSDSNGMATMSAETIGRRIRSRRKELGLTQEHLAMLCQASQAAVSDWETGTGRPSWRSLEALVAHLDCTASWLMGEDPPAAAATDES